LKKVGAGTPEADLGGVFPVLQVPLDEDSRLVESALVAEIEWVFGCGANGVVVGMVSEVLRFSDDERFALAEWVCKHAAGLGPAIISVGAESTSVAVRRAEHAEMVGASALMATPPIAAAGASESELENYYGAILRAVDLPLVIQDASGYVGRGLSIDLQVRLFDEFGERVMFKPEGPPVGISISSIMERTNGGARVFEGLGGGALIESYRRGVIGTMPGADVCWAVVALWRALQRNNFTRAYEIAAPLSALLALQTSLDAFVVIEKHLLTRQGVLPLALCRGPLDFIADEKTMAEVDQLFDRLHQIFSEESPANVEQIELVSAGRSNHDH
jgi:dihydrodipicolinate synthase/N-acetylneuraminate lyase